MPRAVASEHMDGPLAWEAGCITGASLVDGIGTDWMRWVLSVHLDGKPLDIYKFRLYDENDGIR